MNINYDILFRVTMLHEYYTNGLTDDFDIVPTPSCYAMMKSRGFLIRKEENGIVILAKIKPKINGQAPELFTSIGNETLRFAFEMRLRNVYFNNITDLPNHNVGSDVFYFSNLHNAVDNGSPVLGDQIAGSLLGTPMSLLSGYTQNLTFGHELNTATLEIQDIFQNFKTPVPALTHENNSESVNHQIDFRTVEDLSPGRYATHWSGNGTQGLDAGSSDFILEPGIKRNNTFGIIEIFNNTSSFPNNNNINQVPGTHRFLNGNTLVRSGGNQDQLTADFQIRLSSHQPVDLHYVVQIKDNSNPEPSYGSLNIVGFTDISTPEDIAADIKVLRSDNKIVIKEASDKLVLANNLASYSPTMPQPSMDSNMKRINGQDPFYELYYYV